MKSMEKMQGIFLIDYGFKNQGKLPVGDDYEDKNRN